MNKNTKKQWALAINIALSAAVFQPAPVHAAGGSWVCDNDWWDSSSCWSDGGQPQNGDSAVLFQSDGAYRTVSYRTSDPSAVLDVLAINATGGGMMVLSQSQDPLAANYEFIGIDGAGVFGQGGGTNTVGSDLYLGGSFFSTSGTGSGTYYLGGTGSLSVAGIEYIGFSGTGTFIQIGGTNTVTGTMTLAAQSGSSGTYDLSTGSLSVGTNEYVGYGGGNGAFIQSGGTHTVTGTMTLAAMPGSSGSYDLQGGTLTVNGGITNNANGSFNVGAGTTATAGGAGFVNHGLLKGAGTIVGNVTSDGTVDPGASPGELTIDGNYTQGVDGKLTIEIAGTGINEYDILNILGTATFVAGTTIDLKFVNGFAPTANDSFDFLKAYAFSGDMSLISFAVLGLEPGFDFTTSFTDTGTYSMMALTNSVSSVPIPGAVWMFGSGLLGLLGMARRKAA